MKLIPLLLAFAAVCAPATEAPAAGTIYKSVDEAGHVTYSAQLPNKAAKVETLAVESGPSATTREDAIGRLEQAERESTARYRALRKRREHLAEKRREEREHERRKEATVHGHPRYEGYNYPRYGYRPYSYYRRPRHRYVRPPYHYRPHPRPSPPQTAHAPRRVDGHWR